MCKCIEEKVIIKDIFANTLIENKDMYNKALEDVMVELGITGVIVTPQVRYPLFYLKDYLYSRLYNLLSDLKSLDYVSIEQLEFNFLEIKIIGREDD